MLASLHCAPWRIRAAIITLRRCSRGFTRPSMHPPQGRSTARLASNSRREFTLQSIAEEIAQLLAGKYGVGHDTSRKEARRNQPASLPRSARLWGLACPVVIGRATYQPLAIRSETVSSSCRTVVQPKSSRYSNDAIFRAPRTKREPANERSVQGPASAVLLSRCSEMARNLALVGARGDCVVGAKHQYRGLLLFSF